METNTEGVLIVRKEGKVVAVGHNDLEKRSVVFYKVEECSLEDYQELLKDNKLEIPFKGKVD